MLKVMEGRHQVAIAGRVIDAGVRRPMAGVGVSIIEMPAAARRLFATKPTKERRDRTQTRADGFFCFLDLPDGAYTLAASAAGSGKRYGAARGSAVVSRDAATGRMNVPFLEIAIRPTTVQGRVTGGEREDGVTMAEVRVQGSGERVFSNAQGQYAISGVEPGNRTILVAAQGYRAAAKPVTILEPGDLANLNFALVRDAAG